MTSTTSPRKRCELACRPCRHRKIKCQTSKPGGPCDNCLLKSKARECEYIPVAEDYPPPKPRQSPPATNHSYAPLTPISPTTDYGIPSTGAPSPSYYGVYSPYSPPPASPQYASPAYAPTPTTFIASHQHDYQYAQPSSPTQHYAPSSPSTTYNDCPPTGMPMAAGGVEMTSLQPTWDPSQGRYLVNSYMPASTAWPSTSAALPPQLDQPEMAYYSVDQTAAFSHQQTTQQYNGSYYNNS